MGIGAISGLSSYGSISAVKPMNYAVSNEAEVSDVFATETTTQAGAVKGAAPVVYPDSQVEELSDVDVVDPLERQQRTLQVASDYNNIAAQFTTNTTGYGLTGVASTYSSAGSGFDAYA